MLKWVEILQVLNEVNGGKYPHLYLEMIELSE